MPPRKKYPVAKTAELPVGQRKIVTVEGRSIGVFNVDGKILAIQNMCPHQAAPVCQGELKDGHVLVCPDHAWAFDLNTGRALEHPKSLFFYRVEVSNGLVYIVL